jgi:bacterioferritin-associated ferredoxin
MKYDKPTYKQYDDPGEQWLEFKRQADTLSTGDLRRHAGVASDNRHSCTSCFVCAAREVLVERIEAMHDWKR